MIGAKAIYSQSCKKKPIDKFAGSTAWYIFNRENQYPFKVSQAHFRMNAGRTSIPLYGITDRVELRHQENILMDTRGPIIDISDYFRDGAVISVTDGNVAKEIYQRILRHLEGHLHAMQTSRTYEPPEDDTLRELAELATALHYKALEIDPNVDNPLVQNKRLLSLMNARAFIGLEVSKEALTTEPKVPKSLTQMDAIERYMEMLRGY